MGTFQEAFLRENTSYQAFLFLT
jgi:hypothetical protein